MTLNNFKNLNRIKKKKNDFGDLFLITKFIKFKKFKHSENITKIVLNTTFERINFNKKRISLFLLVMEILTLQKIYKQISRKIYVYLNIRKNTFVGCKITLRNSNLYNFIDSLILTLPLMKSRLSSKIFQKNDFSFNFVLTQLINYYQMFNIKQNIINKINVSFIFSSWLLEEKLFLLSNYNIPVKNGI